ncbi:MAG: MauE/DoxX family redox-associated membrane protein [Isosphaeraceae bacterium]
MVVVHGESAAPLRVPRIAAGCGLRAAGGYVLWDGLAIVLLAAPLLKAHQAVTAPAPVAGFLGSVPVLICLVWFELLLGCWILTGLYRRVTRWIVVAAFGLFAVAALALALQGSESCGCFGRVQVNPWYTFAFDAAAALAVGLCPASAPPPQTLWRLPRRLIICCALATCLGGLATWAILAQAPRDLDLGSLGQHAGAVVVLKPETWEGKSFPLIPYLDLDTPTARLNEGRWIAVIYRNDCSHCRSVVPELWALASGRAGVQMAFLEMPPYASPDKSLLAAASRLSSRIAVGRLSDRLQWFAQTPVLVELEDGIVRRAEAGDVDPSRWQHERGRPPGLSRSAARGPWALFQNCDSDCGTAHQGRVT